MKSFKIALVAGASVAALTIGMTGAAKAKPKVVGIPLSSLAGNWASEGNATYGVCYNSTFTAIVDCSSAPEVAFFTQTGIGQGTGDKSGNSCYTVTITNSPEFPNPVVPANTLTQIQTAKTTSYNQATEPGTSSYSGYTAQSGVSCNGATLVNTAGASPAVEGTTIFVVSQNGARVDSVNNSITTSPISYVGDLVGHTAGFKQ